MSLAWVASLRSEAKTITPDGTSDWVRILDGDKFVDFDVICAIQCTVSRGILMQLAANLTNPDGQNGVGV